MQRVEPVTTSLLRRAAGRGGIDVGRVRYVATINGSHNDHQVLDIAADEASRLHAGLTLLYVIVVGWDRGLNQSDDAALRECDKTIENAEGYLKKHDSRMSPESTVVQARSAGRSHRRARAAK